MLSFRLHLCDIIRVQNRFQPCTHLMTLNVYKEATAQKKEFLLKQKKEIPPARLQEKARLCPPAKKFLQTIKLDTEKNGFAWIPDIKKKNPFGNVFFERNYQPVELARNAEKAGASCISVATDNAYYGGFDADFRLTRDAVSVPILRKDFIIDEYQIIEARSMRADCVQLMLTILDNSQARILEQTAVQWGMDVMIVVHNEYEIDRALSHLHSKFILLDNRNTFDGTINLDNARKLVKQIPKGYFTAASTGIKTSQTVESYLDNGIRCFMIGESVLTKDDMSAASRSLFPEPKKK